MVIDKFKKTEIFKKPEFELPGSYSQEDFLETYEKELKRSYRTNLPLTLVTICVDSVPEIELKSQDPIYHNLLNNLILIVTSSLREEDVTHLNANNIINILLINASLDGAQIVKKKITKRLLAYYNSSNNGEFKNILSKIKFKSIPLNVIAGNDEVEATPVYKIKNGIEDNFRFHSEESLDSSNLLWTLPYFDFDLKVVPTAQGAMALCIPLYFNRPQNFSKIFKRSFDLFASMIGILLNLPIIIIASIAIKLSSKGPVFYKQERLGQSGTPFLLYKFRTMNNDSDDSTHREYVSKLINGKNSEINHGTSENPIFKLKKDSRITKVGSILRKTSLDELPQLINILKNDMSLVGPRPPMLYEVESYKNWHLQRIFQAKPGLTGLWQTSGKNETTFEEMVRLDLQYVKMRSTWLDMKIVFKTLPAMLNKVV